jgi:ABC-type transport system involved in multi-copper enzyme maturation permease subunit
MRKVFSIARYTFIEIFRNRAYYVLLLFAILLIVSSLLLGALGGEQRSRMIIDLGLAGIETFSFFVAVFAAVTLILAEMESRTLYLILTRPVLRYEFIVGRFLGLIMLVTLSFLLMSMGHLILLAAEHIHVGGHYALSLLYSWEKIVVITGVGILFSLFSTSTVSALSFTSFLWILGHFSPEIHFLAGKSSGLALKIICDTFYYLAPNFSVMNLRDYPAASLAGSGWLWPAAGYGITYTAVCLALAALLFRRKEF